MTMTTTGTRVRADQVGSLLRPPDVLSAHEALRQGRISQDQLREVEDCAILTALDMQKQVGIDVFTDGEYRRGNWASDFSSSVSGYVQADPPISFKWRMPRGTPPGVEREARAAIALAPQQSGMVIGQRLRQHHRMTEHEVLFLKEHAPGPFKITLPASSYIVARGWKPGITDQAYSSRWDLTEEVAGILRAEMIAMASEGVTYIQVDNPHWPDYIPEDRLAAWRAIGIDPEDAIDEDIRGDNLAVRGLDRSHVILATHICRGNGS
jgi:5-methyltetrahydropteroyltriglutamate--homocysteine methyltransferase